MKPVKKPVVLCILDGWGWAPDSSTNAITRAHTPHWDTIITRYPHTLLDASGASVGLPDNQMGNSEVGHMTIGCGRPLLQDLPRIHQALKAGEIASIPPFQNFIKALKTSRGTAHLMGLLSPGGVHSHQDHLLGMTTLLAEHNIPVALHFFLDGRDTPPCSAKEYVSSFFEALKESPTNPDLVQLATLGGRYYGMDRDNNWDRVSQAYHALVQGDHPTPYSRDDFIQHFYDQDIGDEFIPPHSFNTYKGMSAGDGLFVLNFRADRVRQLLRALVQPDFKSFARKTIPDFSATLGMTTYADDLTPFVPPLFPTEKPNYCLGSLLAEAGLKQLRVAETEKYAHVTFFLNGGREQPYPKEDRALIPSPSVATYDLCPEMSAQEVTNIVTESLENGTHDVIIMNLANADMVGHTGNFKATIKAVEAVDRCLGCLHEAILKTQGILLITADHGNAEQMTEASTGSPHTAHTMNPAPLVFASHNPATIKKEIKKGSLADLAPTILSYLNLSIPPTMTGNNLL